MITFANSLALASVDPEGGTGGPDPPPPGKSQVIWVSIRNPLEKVGPPPPPWKTLTPSGTLKYDRINHLTSVK